MTQDCKFDLKVSAAYNVPRFGIVEDFRVNLADRHTCDRSDKSDQ